jgi:flavin reductase (DIM6/NTAB) family NADH-FMN oxidoreductase RutF
MTGVGLFKQGMRRVSGAVTVVTTRGEGGERRGVTATAVCSLSVDPPLVVACINRGSSVGQMAPASGVFCVNVLSLAQQNIAETFAGRTGLVGENRFAVGAWGERDSGAPVLERALASFDCRLARCVEFATHVMLIGEVGCTLVGADDADALIYVDGAFTTPARGDNEGGHA